MTFLSFLQSQTPTFFWVCVAIIGCILGSFINVVVVRLPIMLKRQWHQECKELKEHVPFNDIYPKKFNLCLPHSQCPQCHTKLRIRDNIPVLSFIGLKGRCHKCNSPISKRYPIIELISSLIIITSLSYFGSTLKGLAVAVMGLCLLALTCIDLDEMLLPDQITLPLLWLGLILNLNHSFTSIEDAVIGAIAGYLSLWSVYWLFKILTGKEGMGYGDFKLFAVFGAWLGWQYLPFIILIASIMGTIVGLYLRWKQNHNESLAFPFGPSIAISGWLHIFYGEYILHWYFSNWI